MQISKINQFTINNQYQHTNFKKKSQDTNSKVSKSEILLGLSLLTTAAIAGVAIHKNLVHSKEINDLSNKITILEKREEQINQLVTAAEEKYAKLNEKIKNNTPKESLAQEVLLLQIEKTLSEKTDYKKIINKSISHKPTYKQHRKKLAELKEAFGVKPTRKKTTQKANSSELKAQYRKLLEAKNAEKINQNI